MKSSEAIFLVSCIAINADRLPLQNFCRRPTYLGQRRKRIAKTSTAILSPIALQKPGAIALVKCRSFSA
jgi:hypothetical protein